MSSFRSSRRLGAAVMSTLLMATLAGCGGDDDGGSPTPPTPPPTSNPDPTPPTPPQPTLSRLKLTGTVTDAPIANAVVTATIGEETFTANADANGNYSLDLEVEEDAADGFITLSARGVGSQSYVEFTSLVGTFSSLQTQAGDDETLSNTENFATQITNVSTAQAVLLQEANGGSPVTSAALLSSLSATLNSQEVLDLATAIKLLVDDADNYPMPDGETSLLALMANTASREQFVDTTYDQNPTVFANAQTAIVTDTTLTRPVSSDSLPASLTAIMLSTDADFSFNYFNRVNAYTFNADGTGTASAGSWNTDTTWTISGSSVEIAYASAVSVPSWDVVECQTTIRQVEASYSSDGVKLTLLNDRTLAITETSHVSYPNLPGDCSNLQAHDVTTTVARTILADDDFQQIDAAELQGSTQSLYVYDAVSGITADIADLNADGTGSTWAFGKQFTWELDETGRIVNVTFSDGTAGRFRSLRDVDSVTTDLLYEIETPDGRRVDAGASVYADPELPLVFTPEALPGRFYQFGVGVEGSSETRTKGFRLRFDADGTGSQEDDAINDLDQLVTRSDSNQPDLGFHWFIDGEDAVIQHTLYLPSLPTLEYNCAPESIDCMVWDERRLVPLVLDGERVYWMEYRRTAPPGETLDDGIPTTLIRFYDYEPFAAPAVVNSKPVVSAKGSARKLRFQGVSQR